MKVALALSFALAVACKRESSSPGRASDTVVTRPAVKPEEPIAEISVDDLEGQLAASACQAVDANGDLTRKRVGTIPGAVLLSDYEAFAMSELPADKNRGLVFYCANEYCSASHEAAKRARFAGYTNVKILPAGIAGWVKAGKTTAKL
jgi:rhodanese-related sulfurtransferase